jgi:hypothetical protein
MGNMAALSAPLIVAYSLLKIYPLKASFQHGLAGSANPNIIFAIAPRGSRNGIVSYRNDTISP